MQTAKTFQKHPLSPINHHLSLMNFGNQQAHNTHRLFHVFALKKNLKIKFNWKLPRGTGKLKCFRDVSMPQKLLTHGRALTCHLSNHETINGEYLWACLYCHGNNFRISQTIVAIALSSSFFLNLSFCPFINLSSLWQQLL